MMDPKDLSKILRKERMIEDIQNKLNKNSQQESFKLMNTLRKGASIELESSLLSSKKLQNRSKNALVTIKKLKMDRELRNDHLPLQDLTLYIAHTHPRCNIQLPKLDLNFGETIFNELFKEYYLEVKAMINTVLKKNLKKRNRNR